MSTNLDLKALIYSSKTHFATMRQYDRFFASLFGAELVNFGYERLNNNGFYEGISSIPQIAEIFAETMAYQVMQ